MTAEIKRNAWNWAKVGVMVTGFGIMIGFMKGAEKKLEQIAQTQQEVRDHIENDAVLHSSYQDRMDKIESEIFTLSTNKK